MLTDDPNERWTRLIHRADFLDTLINAIPSDSLHLNHNVKIFHHGDYAEIEFENGVKMEADLVVAADGIRSLTRNLFFSQAEPVFHGYMPIVHLLMRMKHMVWLLKTHCRIVCDGKVNLYLLPLKYRNQVSVDITVPHHDRTGSPKVPKEDMLNELKDSILTFKKLLKISIIGMFAHYMISIQLNSGAMNCITLLGDAAHSMLHNQGQGANMAIQDAGVLAECLLEAETVAEALQNYETQRKPI